MCRILIQQLAQPWPHYILGRIGEQLPDTLQAHTTRCWERGAPAAESWLPPPPAGFFSKNPISPSEALSGKNPDSGKGRDGVRKPFNFLS